MTAGDLSGRLYDLEKQVLALPSQADWIALSVSSSNRFNIVEGDIDDLYLKFEDLNRKVVNLQLFGFTGSTTGNHFHVYETPGGVTNGVNSTFTLQTIPVPSSSLTLSKNGLIQKPGPGNDFILLSNVITFAPDNVPQAGANLTASYTI